MPPKAVFPPQNTKIDPNFVSVEVWSFWEFFFVFFGGRGGIFI